MARKTASKLIKPTEPNRPGLKISLEKAKSLLQDRIEKGKELRQTQIGSQHLQINIQHPQINIQKEFVATNWEFTTWDSYNSDLLKQMFTTEAFAVEYKRCGSTTDITPLSLEEKITNIYEKIDEKITSIESIIERLKSFH